MFSFGMKMHFPGAERRREREKNKLLHIAFISIDLKVGQR